jgi:hypothetical protein
MTDIQIDPVRASKAGHQFHEAWVARSALSLLLVRNELYAIAVEGLSEEDEEGVSGAVVEIADATFYFGAGASLETCSRMEVAQFKYSITLKDSPLRIADARKTLKKFAKTETEFSAKHGAACVAAKLRYSFNTNRPISDGMVAALLAAANGETPRSGDARAQHQQLCEIPLAGEQLKSFASRIILIGRMENLQDVERGTPGRLQTGLLPTTD